MQKVKKNTSIHETVPYQLYIGLSRENIKNKERIYKSNCLNEHLSQTALVKKAFCSNIYTVSQNHLKNLP